jgi:hypothetical protein
MYDSTNDVLQHRALVEKYMRILIIELLNRCGQHDISKLSPEEKPLFDELTPMLKATEYGSPEYHDHIKQLGVALKHHYANNRHHCEHFPNGIDGMNLIDLCEMICDWKASTARQQNGNILKSIDLNADKLKHSVQLANILTNTAKEMFEKQ